MWKENSFENHTVLILSGHSDSTKIINILESVGFRVDVSRTTAGFRERLFCSNYDVAIIMESVNKQILMDNQFSAIPKNLSYTRSSALVGEDNKIDIPKYLEYGFDDVCFYPIDTDLLILRVQNLLRMIINGSESTFNRGLITLYYDSNELQVGNTKVYLNKFETIFIKNLIYSTYLSPEILKELIYKETGRFFTITNLRVKIHRLKKKIYDQSGYKPIKTRKDHGYFLVS